MSTAKPPVKIGGIRKTLCVELPSIEGSQVELYCSLLVSEQRKLQEKYPDMSTLSTQQQTDMSLFLLTLSIKEWNLVNDDESPTPVGVEAFDKLTQADILKMLEVCTGQDLLDENNRPLSVANPVKGKKANAS